MGVARRGDGGGASRHCTRPVGAVLVVVVAVYAWQWRRPQMLVAAIGPLVGLGSFLLWAGSLDPLRLQSKSNLRGKFVDPARACGARSTIPSVTTEPDRSSTSAGSAIALALDHRGLAPPSTGRHGVRARCRSPLRSTSYNLDSFERYLFAAFPVAIAGALVLRRRPVEYAVIAAPGGALVAYSIPAFTTTYIP